MDWQDMTGIVLWVNASWPDQKLEPPTATVWYEDLEHEDAGVVGVALRRLRRQSLFRPQLASILDMCRAVRHERLAATRNPHDATRHCGTCATSSVVGWIAKDENDLETWYPCPSCRAAQHLAWADRVK